MILCWARRKMIGFKQWTVAMVSVAAISAPLWLLYRSGDAGFAPVAALFSGWVFMERPIITGGALDQFSLHKELFILSFSYAVICPFIAFARWINGHGLRIVRLIFAIVSLVILVHPLSILIIFSYDVSRYVYHMGVTPMRLLALALAIPGYLTIAAFAAWVCGVKMKWPNKGISSLIILVHPLALLTIFTYFLSLYIYHERVTPVNLLALTLAIIGYLTIAAFAAWMCGVKMRWLNKSVDTYVSPGAGAGGNDGHAECWLNTLLRKVLCNRCTNNKRPVMSNETYRDSTLKRGFATLQSSRSHTGFIGRKKAQSGLPAAQ